MKVEMISHPSGDQIPIVLDIQGMPMPIQNEFLLSRRALSSNTLLRNAKELSVLCRWQCSETIDIFDRIISGINFKEAELSSLMECLRREQSRNKKVRKVAICVHTFNQRLITARQYISWCFDVTLGALSLKAPTYEMITNEKLRVLANLSKAYIKSPPVNKILSKGLTAKEQEFLVAAVEPSNEHKSRRRSAVQYRNYIAVMIMLLYGLRPGELLSLRVEDVEIGAISCIRVKRRHQDVLDTRRPRPQIKRNGRVLPIEEMGFAKKLDDYIMVWREELQLAAKTESPYLILSDDGAPLSQSTITQLFQRLRMKHEDNLPKHLSAKALRHTFSRHMERLLRQQGIEEGRRQEILAHLRGDSSLSSQNVYIQQEIDELSNITLKNYHRNLFIEDIPW